jgi:hypothetical protein
MLSRAGNESAAVARSAGWSVAVAARGRWEMGVWCVVSARPVVETPDSLCLSDSARLECSLTFYSHRQPSDTQYANGSTSKSRIAAAQVGRGTPHPHVPHDTP